MAAETSLFKAYKMLYARYGDHNLVETVANVLTSLPFIVLGIQTPRKNFNTTLYANSLIGVGVASTLYHSSRGKLRKYLRKSLLQCLSRAIRNENPKLLMAASALLLPVQPLMVSAVHTGMMELLKLGLRADTVGILKPPVDPLQVAFAKRAVNDPELRKAHDMHKMSSLLGAALFIADDMFPGTPFLHSAWHLAAAVGAGTCNKLLE
ncbi:hypothetical protein F3Y22_tig00002237pilonHSYRG00137 [Hibiscus syriacus]|uniref:Uncharacterized protein n=1 Tax=Hibiscus syriacus TaxID=106335 RepID=A0A6A3CR88_HIBSY|nr:hypothetical protein F3Y22_tig00002237pilonHSYRG00137 [Hibiscus syriacus]